jgi:hypothetical protein
MALRGVLAFSIKFSKSATLGRRTSALGLLRYNHNFKVSVNMRYLEYVNNFKLLCKMYYLHHHSYVKHCAQNHVYITQHFNTSKTVLSFWTGVLNIFNKY